MGKFSLMMVMCCGQFGLYAVAESVAEIVAPFEEVVDRFSKNQRVDHTVTKKEFDKRATSALAFLKKNQKDWQSLVDPKKDDVTLKNERAVFEKKPYVLRVFATKPGTLIFQMKDEPNVIIKIDNRPPDAFNSNFRSYYAAYEKSQSVQTSFKFAQLFLPFEYGRDSREAGVKFVFSEKVPLFSDAEIDNMVLMHVMHRKADENAKLKGSLKSMFEEMLFYICHVDFDDINYRNVPFTSDGRFAPFDTDSFRAQQGVFSFLKDFDGFKVFSSYADAKPTVQSSCAKQPVETSLGNPFKNVKGEQDLFSKNQRIFEAMLTFFEKKPLLRGKIKGPENLYHHVAKGNEAIAAAIDQAVEKNLINPNFRAQTFGRRCHHAQDLIFNVKLEIEAQLSPGVDANRKIADALNEGKNAGVVYFYGDNTDIHKQKNVLDGLEPFVCF